MLPARSWGLATEWQSNPQGQVRLIVPYLAAPSSGKFLAGIQFRTIPGWHVYWKNSGDAGFAPVFDFSQSQGIGSVEVYWPAPQRHPVKGGLEAFGYEGEIAYPIETEVHLEDANAILLVADVDYLTCKVDCVPYRYLLRLRVPVQPEVIPDPQVAPLLEKAVETVPRPVQEVAGCQITAFLRKEPLTLEILVVSPELPSKKSDVFLEEQESFEIGHAVSELTAYGIRFSVPLRPTLAGRIPEAPIFAWTVTGVPEEGRAIETRQAVPWGILPNQPVKPPGWGLYLLFAFLGGLILNVMPCVLPVLSIKLFGLIKTSGSGRGGVVGYALATTLGILASFWALAGAAVAANAAGKAAGWGVQFQEPVFVAFLTVIVILFSLNLWGLFEIVLPGKLANWAGSKGEGGLGGHFFSGVFATLLATPCSAPFLGTAVGFALSQAAGATFAIFTAIGLGMAAPYLLLALAPSMVRLLPKPGPWMETLRGIMGFFLAGAAVWLLFVLAGLIGSAGLAWVELCLLGLALALWLRSQTRAKRTWATLALLSGVGAVMLAGSYGENQRESAVLEDSGVIAWVPFDEARIAEYLASGKKVFVDVTADWCFTCKVNEKAVLESFEVASAFRRGNIVPMKADWTSRNDAIRKFLARFGKYGIPFYVLYHPGGEPHIFGEVLTQEDILQVFEPLPSPN